MQRLATHTRDLGRTSAPSSCVVGRLLLWPSRILSLRHADKPRIARAPIATLAGRHRRCTAVRRGEARVSDHRLVLQLARLLQRTDPWSLLAISNRATIAVMKSTVLPPAARASTGPLAARSRRRLAGAAERPVATSIARTRLGGRRSFSLWEYPCFVGPCTPTQQQQQQIFTPLCALDPGSFATG